MFLVRHLQPLVALVFINGNALFFLFFPLYTTGVLFLVSNVSPCCLFLLFFSLKCGVFFRVFFFSVFLKVFGMFHFEVFCGVFSPGGVLFGCEKLWNQNEKKAKLFFWF
jgi:hypothetical protein